MINSVLLNKTRQYVYREGNCFLMTKQFLIAEVMIYKKIFCDVYGVSDFIDVFYPEEQAEKIIDILWEEIKDNGEGWENSFCSPADINQLNNHRV